MAHEHASNAGNYWADQLCMVGAAGALGVISVLMWQMDKLVFLAPFFRWAVLAGGVALLAIALIRGWTIWHVAGKAANHDHHHDHDHDGPCDHDHDLEHADCGHEHNHSWMPAKYALMLLPVALFLLGLPHAGFSVHAMDRFLGKTETAESTKEVAVKGEMVLGFSELNDAQYSTTKQAEFEGHVVVLKGMFWPVNNDKVFTLVRFKGKCCTADAIPLKVQIIAPKYVNQYQPKEWVSVKGKVEFRKLAGKDKVIPVLIIEEMDDIKRIPKEPEVDFS